MVVSFWFYTIHLEWPFNISRDNRYNFHSPFLSQKIVSFIANSVDPDKMLHYETFHLVFTVCQTTHLGIKNTIYFNQIKSIMMDVLCLASTD